MAIELSNLTFTNRADVVPASGVEQILNTGIANTLAGSDIITGISTGANLNNNVGINNYYGVIDTGAGNDTITGIATGGWGYGIQNYSTNATIDTGAGKDTITATGFTYGIYNIDATINTGAGEDIIIATGGDSGITNGGTIDTGDGSDTITGIGGGDGRNYGIANTVGAIIDTGNGNDIITGTGGGGIEYDAAIQNDGIIDTGNGEDSIIAYGGFSGMGRVFLGNGQDYLKGFGSGTFNGGSGKDTLELTSGIYTVGISPAGVNFAKDGIIMNTSEFEQLIAGDTTYNFSNLTNGQTIFVA